MKPARVLDPALFHESAGADDSAPVLSGARCGADGTVVFPYQGSCPRCSGRAMAEVALPRHGTLWSWTVQHFAPKSPYLGPVGADFVPFPVGYVDLGEVIVQARLHLEDVDALRIGMPMKLSWLRISTPAASTEDDVLTYAFTPLTTPRDHARLLSSEPDPEVER